MANVLRKLRVDRIASVDRGAGENCEIVLMKRRAGNGIFDNAVVALRKSIGAILTDETERNEMLEQINLFADHLRTAAADMHKSAPEKDDPDAERQLVAAIAAAGHRAKQQMRKTEMPEMSMVEFAESVIEKGRSPISKAAFNQVITAKAEEYRAAQAKVGKMLSRQQAYARFIETPDGSKMFQVLKYAGGPDHAGTDTAAAAPPMPKSSASMDKLNSLARAHQAATGKKFEDAFTAVYTAPENRDLVAQEKNERLSALQQRSVPAGTTPRVSDTQPRRAGYGSDAHWA